MSFERIDCKDREAWLQFRREGIGGSDAAAVVGCSPFGKTATDLWGEKVGLVEPSTEENLQMRVGLLLEDDVAQLYSEETERLVVLPPRVGYEVCRSTKHPFMLATVDGEIVPIDDRGPGLWEAKTAAFYKKEEWESGEPPLTYLIQFQHSLAVKGYQWGSMGVLLGNSKFLWVDLDRNDDFIEILVEKERVFWDLVKAETPPAIDGSESVKELLKRLYPKETPKKTIELPLEAVDWHTELRDVKEGIRKLNDRATELKNYFVAAMQDAEMGVLPSGDSYSLKTIHKEPYTVAPEDYRELRFRPKKERR